MRSKRCTRCWQAIADSHTPVSGRNELQHCLVALIYDPLPLGSLSVPACRTVTIGPRAFVVACPKSWNSLPRDLRVPGITQGEFRNKLKTVLFEEMLACRLCDYFFHSSEQLFCRPEPLTIDRNRDCLPRFDS